MRQIVVLALLAIAQPSLAQKHSSDYTAPWQVYARGLLEDSIAFRTVRGENQVVAYTDYLAKQFLDNGFDEDDVHLLPMDSDGEAAASLVVRYPGTSDAKAILFVAHTDVVPAVGADWELDPFELHEADGHFRGRGVIDDKFGVTILTTTFLRLKGKGFVPRRDLVIAFTGDEETEQSNIQELVADHFDLIDAEFAFNLDSGTAGLANAAGEPIAEMLQYAEKTYADFEITARTPGGHSSKPTQNNAIFNLANALRGLQQYEFPIRATEASRTYFASMGEIVGGELGAAMRAFAADPGDEDAIRVLTNEPEYVGKIRTTCVPTLLRGGHVINALPEEATVSVNCRIYPGVTTDEVESHLAKAIADPELDIKRTWDPKLSPPSPVRPDVLALIMSVVEQHTPGVPVIPVMESGATDSKFLRRGGIDSYGMMGLFMPANTARQHSSNERIPVDGYFAALEFWHSMVQEAAAF